MLSVTSTVMARAIDHSEMIEPTVMLLQREFASAREVQSSALHAGVQRQFRRAVKASVTIDSAVVLYVVCAWLLGEEFPTNHPQLLCLLQEHHPPGIDQSAPVASLLTTILESRLAR